MAPAFWPTFTKSLPNAPTIPLVPRSASVAPTWSTNEGPLVERRINNSAQEPLVRWKRYALPLVSAKGDPTSASDVLRTVRFRCAEMAMLAPFLEMASAARATASHETQRRHQCLSHLPRLFVRNRDPEQFAPTRRPERGQRRRSGAAHRSPTPSSVRHRRAVPHSVGKIRDRFPPAADVASA